MAMECKILSGEREVFFGEVTGLFARAAEGWVGILPGHAPAVFALLDAPVRVMLRDGQRTFRVKAGLIEVRKEGTMVFGDEVVELA